MLTYWQLGSEMLFMNGRILCVTGHEGHHTISGFPVTGHTHKTTWVFLYGSAVSFSPHWPGCGLSVWCSWLVGDSLTRGLSLYCRAVVMASRMRIMAAHRAPLGSSPRESMRSADGIRTAIPCTAPPCGRWEPPRVTPSVGLVCQGEALPHREVMTLALMPSLTI